MDAEFLLDESRRLLGLPVRGQSETPAWKLELAVSSPVAEPVAATGEMVEADGIMVAVQLDTAPHCQNCIADLRKICGALDGFRDLGAKPNEAVIMVVFEVDQVDQKALLAALEAGGRPGKLP